MTAQVVNDPSIVLVRGMTVVVGDSYPVEDLHGKKMTVASKGVVKCKGKDCDDSCPGFALFVTRPEDYVDPPTKERPWRTGTIKICLSQLLDKKKQSLAGFVPPADTSAGEDAPKRKRGRPKKTEAVADAAPKRKPGRPPKVKTDEPIVKKRRGRPKKDTSTAVAVIEAADELVDENGNGADVTWEMLSTAVHAGDHATVTMYARKLKARVEYLQACLIEALLPK